MTFLLVPSGVLCIAISLAHSYLGETRLIRPATFPSRQARRLVGCVWHLSTAVWIASGAVIAAAPWLFADGTRRWAVPLACLPLIWGVLGNAWATRGRHVGWMLMAAVVAAALLGSNL